MDLINSKNKINDEIHKIIESYQSNEKSHNNEMKLFTGEVERLNQFNNKLLSEIREKDKILSTHEKTIHDYSVMINELQEKSNKELSDKEKFDMIKVQDKEIHLRDQKIKDLEKKIEELTSNKKKTNNKSKTLVEKMKDITESQKGDKEVVEVVEEKKQLQRSKSEEELLLTGDIVDERTPSEIEEDNQNSELQKVIEDTAPPAKVAEAKAKAEKVEDVEKPKESSDDDDETSDDELEVEIITHYKKEYYIKSNEKDPQYIYAIDDGDIGDVVGEMKGKKKVLYDK